jgi:predicted Zn-dependent protease
VGKITDREGTAGRRGLAEPRWSPADARTLVLPGDWIKTGTRGANALAVELGGGSLLLGPGALLEVVDASRVRLHAGEVELTPRAGGKLVVDGPAPPSGNQARDVTARTVLRAANGALEALAQDPRWLTGYRQNASTEAVGALLATVDGRDVPLTLGYHKVTVDIRDQLARTEIEESFVNHTSQVLEGVFYFPLPADASISGFSMWIGDQQVHGEIVEKQRARAIYETILREKRDPGLLEWSGGNLFKARVYPIGAEKRIKITYTQVLPQTIRPDGKGELVYSHALASEHLRLHPLAKLSLAVTVSSSRPIVEVTSPTHACRIQKTDHAARVEHEAEEVSPDRDFEVRLAVTRPASGMTFASHRRGDDGYFLLLVDAPMIAPSATAGEPLDLLILADTSGSLAGAARDAQLRFIAALLEGLGPKDTFSLATCDTDVRWAFDRPQPATPAAREAALGHVEGRRPLGWTDLDRAVAAAAERAGPKTHVVYVGDGAVTTGDADPQAFARRAPSLYKGKGSFHTVVPGSSAETSALRAIAALGGGSVRSIGGAEPQDVAFALLKEVASTRVRDVRVAFEGLAVAAVYPEVLPDLPAGGQHVLVGRWDPATAPAAGVRGKVTLTGLVGDAKLSTSHDVAFGQGVPTGAEPPDDASFIPRLWARAHLEHLLSQGSSKELQAQVVTLSEDFQLITPYTSFLVLETDADRERFQVKKRFRMRDGEEFFAKGRDDAQHALAREAALAARRWRQQLRAKTLEALADLNRGLTPALLLLQGGWGGGGGYAFGRAGASRTASYDGAGFERQEMLAATATPMPVTTPTTTEDADLDAPAMQLADDEAAGEEPSQPEAPAEAESNEVMKEAVARAPSASRAAFSSEDKRAFRRGPPGTTGDRYFTANQPGVLVYRGLVDGTPASLFDGLVAGLPDAPGEPPARAWPAAWPKEVQDALAPIDLATRVAAAQGGLRIHAAVQRADARARTRAAGEALWLLAGDRWATASLHRDGEDVRVDWLTKDQRGAVNAVWSLGRARPPGPGDARAWSAPWDHAQGYESLAGLAAWTATARRLDAGQVELTFSRQDTAQRLVLVVEPAKGVVRSATWFAGDAVQSAVAFDVAEVAGAWYPTRMVRTDGAGKVVETTTFTVELLAPAPFDAALTEVLAVRARSMLLKPLPALRAGRAAAKEGKATLEDRWALLGQLAAAQRWDAARPHLDAVLGLVPALPATALRATALLHSRRHEELRVEVLRAAGELVATPRPAEVAAALHLLGWSGVLSDGSERLDLVTKLSTVVARHPDLEDARWSVDQQEVQALQMLGRPDEALARLRALVARHPERLDGHQQLAYWLMNAGDPEAGVAHLDEALAKLGPWPAHERSALAQVAASILWNSHRLEALVARAERLERDDPEASAQLAGMHLGALVMLDRADAAWQKAVAWIEPALGAGAATLDDLARARLVAAVQHALGQGPGVQADRVEDDRAAHLARVVNALVRTPERADVTRSITQDWRWSQHVVGRATVTALVAVLRKEAATLPPAGAVAFFYTIRTAGPAAHETDAKVWDEVLDAFEARVKALRASDPAGAQALRDAVFAYGGVARQLRLLREDHAEAKADAKADARDAAYALTNAILAQPWTGELEDEAAALLVEVGPRADDEAFAAQGRRDAQTQLLLALVDWATQQRAAAEVAARPDHGELDRRRLAAANDEALRAARVKTLERLAALGPQLPAQADWLALERTWLQVKLGRPDDREAARGACLALLDGRLEAAAKTPPTARDRVVAARALATLLYLVGTDEQAAQAASGDALAQRLERGLAASDTLVDWREAKVALLLLRDQAAALEAALRAWLGEADVESARWGLPLTYVLAERDALAEAAAVLERLAADDEVGHGDLQRLSTYYTALDQKDAARAAKARAWALVDEWTISSSLQQDAQRVSRTREGVPEELDPETAVKLVVLLRKAEHPENHVWTVRQLYETTRDFRLLEGLAEGVLGHSAQKIYRLLEGLRNVTGSLQEEATLDRLSAALTALHGRADATPVDRRALRLLELIVERQAADQTQGAGPHLERALTALREAWGAAESREGAWAPGEPVLYAQLLANQGVMPGALGTEQLRQLRALVRRKCPPDEVLSLALPLANTLWAHGVQDEALRTLAAALALVRGKDELLPPRHHHALDVLASFYMSQGRYSAAEGLYERELAPPDSPARHGAAAARGLRLSLFRVWNTALEADAEVRLGKRRALYEAARDALRADLAARTDESHALQLLQALCGLWSTAKRRVGPVADDVTRFAFGELPAVLGQYQHRNSSYMVSLLVEALAEHRDAATALELLVARAEAEPRWLRLQSGHLWAQQGWRFGQLRADVGAKLPATLAQRLLDLVKRELAADLRAQRGGGQSICSHVNNGHFWREQLDAFAQVARDVLASRRDVEVTVVHVASYLHDSLGRQDEGIAVLLDADQRGVLGWSARHQLCAWLQQAGRWAESLPIAERLVTEQPASLEARCQVMRALFHTKRGDALARALTDAEAYLRETKAWGEGPAATLGALCVEVSRPLDAVRFLDEAVAHHTRSRPDRGIGGGTLSYYYQQLANAHLGLGDTDAAVDAACGAVVAWGGHEQQRAQALETLVSVLVAAKDLDAYVARVDRAAQESKLENPTLRKALGNAYRRLGKQKQAEVQLRLSLEAQPNDVAVHRALIEVLDVLQRPAEAAEQLLALATISGHEASLYSELGQRWARLGQAELAERAWTNLVEMLPHEAESHEALAKVREDQGRLPDAIEQWRQVVRVRTDEPTGWLGLARALSRTDGGKQEAAEVARKLLGAEWDARFGDVHAQAQQVLNAARR